MTKEEAYERLELKKDTDLQTIRKKFAQLHNDYRMRIDNAPTARMKQIFEQGLEDLKKAYTVLNNSSSIDDTAELPRINKSSEDEKISSLNQHTKPNENPNDLFEEPSPINRNIELEHKNITENQNNNSPSLNFPNNKVGNKKTRNFIIFLFGILSLAVFLIWQYSSIIFKKSTQENKLWSANYVVQPGLDQELVLRNKMLTPKENNEITKNSKLNASTFAYALQTGDSLYITNETSDYYTIRWKDGEQFYLIKNELSKKYLKPLINDHIKTKIADNKSEPLNKNNSDAIPKTAINNNSNASKSNDEKTEKPINSQTRLDDWQLKSNKELYFQDGFAKVEVNNKKGFIDKHGELTIPLKYDYADNFKNGYAIVGINEKYGLINKKGKEVIPLKYDQCNHYCFSGKCLVRIELDEKSGYLDLNGKVVIPMVCEDGAPGYQYWNEKGWLRIKKEGEWVYIDMEGNVVAI